MAQAQHTPGPWTAEPEGGRGAWVRGSNGTWAALACGDTDAEADANAHLIAAAPDMLVALQMAVPALEWCQKQWASSPQQGSGINVLAVVRATLADAEGR